jgi:hypothetical protein
LRSIDIEETDPATADAMTVRLALAGRGSEEVTDQELRAILDYVASLYLDTAGLPEGPTPTPEVFQPLPPESAPLPRPAPPWLPSWASTS